MQFVDDDRGVSTVIGAVLIFGFLIILLSIWQAQVVPTENAKTEYSHYTDAQEDATQLRSDYIDAAESGITRSSSVQLGTVYRPRVFFVSAPPPTGQLKTDTQGSGELTATGFDVSSVCGADSSVTTRSLTFNTDYNHLSDSEAPPLTYENTVLYKQTPDGRVIFESGQTLVQGSTINLYPFMHEYSESGVGAASIDFMGAETGSTSVDGTVSLTIPTDLSATQWEELLRNQPNFESASQVGPQRVQLVLADAQWDVQCAAVGTDRTPAVDPPTTPTMGTGDTTGPTVTSVDTSTDEVLPGESFELTATISDYERGGTDVTNTEWWSDRSSPGGSAGDGFSLQATDGEFDQYQENVSSTIDTSGWSPGTHTLSVRGRDGNGNWGPTDTTTISVIASGLSASGGTAWNVSDDDGFDNPNHYDGLEFSLTNSLGDTIEITGVKVKSSVAQRLDELSYGTANEPWESEVWIAADDNGYAEYSDGQRLNQRLDMTTTATIDSGSTGTIYLYEFEKQNGSPIDIENGDSFRVTVYYRTGPGPEESTTVDVTVTGRKAQ